MPMPYNSFNSPIFAPYGLPTQNIGNYPQNAPTGPISANTSIIWVQGESGAKSYLVGAGNSVVLMDSEQNRFYIKTTDASGMPAPLRIFEYSEISHKTGPICDLEQNQGNLYVTHEELERRLNTLELRYGMPTDQPKEPKTEGKNGK